jgi:hypothetical protein
VYSDPELTDNVDSVTFLDDWSDAAEGLLTPEELESAVDGTVSAIASGVSQNSSSVSAMETAIANAMSAVSVDDASVETLADLGTVAFASLSYWNANFEEWQDSVAAECDSLCIPGGQLRVTAQPDAAAFDFWDGLVAVAEMVGTDVGVGGLGQWARNFFGGNSAADRASVARDRMRHDSAFRQAVRDAVGPNASRTTIFREAVSRVSRSALRTNLVVMGAASAVCGALSSYTGAGDLGNWC